MNDISKDIKLVYDLGGFHLSIEAALSPSDVQYMETDNEPIALGQPQACDAEMLVENWPCFSGLCDGVVRVRIRVTLWHAE